MNTLKDNELCHEEKVQTCEKFTGLDSNEPSIFILHAEGRLGNHLMAFAIVMALAKSLKIRFDIRFLGCAALLLAQPHHPVIFVFFCFFL